jgi:hypothetical protein
MFPVPMKVGIIPTYVIICSSVKISASWIKSGSLASMSANEMETICSPFEMWDMSPKQGTSTNHQISWAEGLVWHWFPSQSPFLLDRQSVQLFCTVKYLLMEVNKLRAVLVSCHQC